MPVSETVTDENPVMTRRASRHTPRSTHLYTTAPGTMGMLVSEEVTGEDPAIVLFVTCSNHRNFPSYTSSPGMRVCVKGQRAGI